MDLEFVRKLLQPAERRIVLLVMDGLGGLPGEKGGKTELEDADTPHLDALANEGICGLHVPIRPGITPGSGPSHLALFGYDPIEYQVGRGVLSALGVDFPLAPSDVAARGNFCTVDNQGKVTDRRAGRISSDRNRELCEMLRQIKLSGAECVVQTVKEHRFLLVLKGDDLSGEISDTDPQHTGLEPQRAEARSADAGRTADLVNEFVAQAREILMDESPANMVLMRGFSQRPDWPQVPDVFGLNAAAIAGYPMYRGLAKLIGMQELETGEGLEGEFDTLATRWQEFDFFYVHAKHVDSAGEDGDFDRKKQAIESVDVLVPRLIDLDPGVVIVTGDHSTPAVQHYHSWHPVPVLLWSKVCRPDTVRTFGERACMTGGLGPRMPATDLMPLALANTGRLAKFGA